MIIGEILAYGIISLLSVIILILIKKGYLHPAYNVVVSLFIEAAILSAYLNLQGWNPTDLLGKHSIIRLSGNQIEIFFSNALLVSAVFLSLIIILLKITDSLE